MPASVARTDGSSLDADAKSLRSLLLLSLLSSELASLPESIGEAFFVAAIFSFIPSCMDIAYIKSYHRTVMVFIEYRTVIVDRLEENDKVLPVAYNTMDRMN